MKIKLIAILFILCAFFSSCQSDTPKESGEINSADTKALLDKTREEASVTQEETEEEKTTAEKKPLPQRPLPTPVVADPFTVNDLNAIPIANANMSIAQLRQICVDFMNLQLTFSWQPTRSLSYSGLKDNIVTIYANKAYGGHPYVSNNQSNLYRVFYYYDQETGLLDIDKMNGNYGAVMGNQCSSNSFWAWSRVINTISWGGTNEMTASFGCLPVSPCTYNTETVIFLSGSTPKTICEQNGRATMYEAYANLLPADGIVQSGHVQMVTRASVIARKEDGSIDGANSFVYLQDQQSHRAQRTQSDGTPILVQAGVEHAFSFEKLYSQGYLPFTFKEFQGLDPIENGYAQIVELNSSVTISELFNAEITANYPISDVSVLVTDQNGELVDTVFGFERNASNLVIYATSLSKMGIFQRDLTPYDDGDYSVKVNVRIGNGEIHTVYQGLLTDR